MTGLQERAQDQLIGFVEFFFEPLKLLQLGRIVRLQFGELMSELFQVMRAH
jgi:hypothetical protein